VSVISVAADLLFCQPVSVMDERLGYFVIQTSFFLKTEERESRIKENLRVQLDIILIIILKNVVFSKKRQLLSEMNVIH
jgi:hypothetical protein